MRIIIEDDCEIIDTEELTLDSDRIQIVNINGYGGCHVDILYNAMTWEQVDKLKEAIALAEERWRK